jgi:excisionase family DNA binding protein
MPAWWTAKQLAEHYGLSERTIYDAISSGDLVAHRFGRGRGGVRVADRDRLDWERRCRSPQQASTASRSSTTKAELTDLVRKHFHL